MTNNTNDLPSTKIQEIFISAFWHICSSFMVAAAMKMFGLMSCTEVLKQIMLLYDHQHIRYSVSKFLVQKNTTKIENFK